MKNKTRIRAAVIDGDPIRFVGFCSFLASEPDLHLVPLSSVEVSNCQAFDVILLWHHSEAETLKALQRLSGFNLSAPTIVTGRPMRDIAIIQALEYGAKGYIEETTPAPEFARAIRAIKMGSIWVSRRILSAFVEQAQSGGARGFSTLSQSLTARELEVLKMLVAGRSNKEIGVPLGIEERTVKAHVSRLMRKVGVKNRIMLTVRAIEQSLVSAK